MIFLIIETVAILLVIAFCKKENFKIPQAKYSNVSLIIPFSIAALTYLSFFNRLFLFLNFILIVFTIFYYIKKSSSYLRAFVFTSADKLAVLFVIMNIAGGIIINTLKIYAQKNIYLSIILFLTGASLITYSRMGFIALGAEVLKRKKRNEYLAVLGIFGVFGLLIICMVKPKK